jgi:hypothetical protein
MLKIGLQVQKLVDGRAKLGRWDELVPVENVDHLDDHSNKKAPPALAVRLVLEAGDPEGAALLQDFLQRAFPGRKAVTALADFIGGAFEGHPAG